jgi:hypothetical protein
MYYFEITLSTGVVLRWRLEKNLAAWHWLRYAIPLIKSGSLRARFSGFKSKVKTKSELLTRLQRSIDLINESGLYRIEEKVGKNFTQSFSNKMHHHFELLSIPRYFNKTNPKLRQAIGEINFCVHDLEGHDGLIFEKRFVKRDPLPQGLENCFTVDTEFGDLALHYSQVGKTWWIAFLDKDQDILPKAVAPLRHISGDFDIFFTSGANASVKKSFHRYLRRRGLDPKNPALLLGHCIIGKLVRTRPCTYYTKVISQSMQVKHLRLLKGRKVIAKGNVSSNV